MKLHFFDKIKYRTSTIILSDGIKYSMHDGDTITVHWLQTYESTTLQYGHKG